MASNQTPVAHPRERLASVLDQALVYTVALLLLLIPLFMLTIISEYGYGKTMFALVGISLLSILWAFNGWVKDSWRIRWPWITVPFLGFVIASLLSLLYAVNGRVVIQSLVLVVFFFQLLLIIANVVRDRKDVHLLLFALLLSGFLASLYGLLQYLGILPGPFGGSGVRELISTMGNRNYLGGFLSYLMFPTAILVLEHRSRWIRAVTIAMIAFCFAMVTLVQQTGSLLGLMMAAVALIIGWSIFRPMAPLRRNWPWILLLIASLALANSVTSPDGVLRSTVGLPPAPSASPFAPLRELISEEQLNLESASEEPWTVRLWEKYSDRTRTWDWWVGWEMFKDYPFVGIGLGNYKLNFIAYKTTFLSTPRGKAFDYYIPRAAQAHNDYVQALAEIGGIGFTAIIATLAMLIISFWQRIRSNYNQVKHMALLLLASGVVTFLAHAVVSFPSHLPASSLVFVALIGIAYSRVYGESTVGTFSLSRWKLPISVVTVVVIGIIVSGFAVADLSANILMTEGIKQLQMGNAYSAEALLSRSLQLDFAPRQTYFHLASAQLRLNRLDDAWENLQYCMTRFRDEAVYLTYANLGANKGELVGAQAAIDILLGSQPYTEVEWQARYIESVIAIHQDEYSRAVMLLESLIQDAPSFEIAFLALADIFAAQGLTHSARSNLEKALMIIDGKLALLNIKLEKGVFLSVAEYGELRAEVEKLHQEREIAIDRLGKLP